jgi:hypothetical protein
MTSNQSLVAAGLLALLAGSAGAQGVGDITAAAQPQFVSMKIGSGASSRTVSQFTVPLIIVVPVTTRLNFDLATAFASSDVSEPGIATSSITGLTDTQVRANLTLGSDAVVVTVGANLPTGRYLVPDGEVKAAGQIGSDFLMFPTSSYGSGFSTTGGVALARAVGSWNVGLAGSFRKSTRFDAFRPADATGSEALTFTPADEVRARVGVDRFLGAGRLAIGVTYSTFGNDVLANTSYATGDRVLGQASYAITLGSSDLFVSGWGLHRAAGQQYGGIANPETLLNGLVALGVRRGAVYLEPNIEGRSWQVDGTKAGLLGAGGLRLRWTSGVFTLSPSATYQAGKLYSTTDGSSVSLTGWRASLSIRVH